MLDVGGTQLRKVGLLGWCPRPFDKGQLEVKGLTLKTLYLCKKHAKLLEGNNREVMTALEVMKSAPSARRTRNVDATKLQGVLGPGTRASPTRTPRNPPSLVRLCKAASAGKVLCARPVSRPGVWRQLLRLLELPARAPLDFVLVALALAERGVFCF